MGAHCAHRALKVKNSINCLWGAIELSVLYLSILVFIAFWPAISISVILLLNLTWIDLKIDDFLRT